MIHAAGVQDLGGKAPTSAVQADELKSKEQARRVMVRGWGLRFSLRGENWILWGFKGSNSWCL